MIESPALTMLATATVTVVVLFLFAQGVLALWRPDWVRAFLGGFAASARAHFLELLLRILAGLAFVQLAPGSAWPPALHAFGLLLIVTSTLLLFVPWRLHRRFAAWAVPMATRWMPGYALACLLAAFAAAAAMVS